MRRLFDFFVVALVMFAAIACDKNEDSISGNSGEKEVIITARIGNASTKSSLGNWDESKLEYPVLWSEDDYIAVVNNGKLLKFKLSSGANTTVGTFTCTFGSAYYDPTKPIQAFYPSSSVSYDADTKEISYVVPETQAYAPNSFGLDAMPMAAYAANEDEGLVFDNLFGVVKLQLTGAAGEGLRCVEFVSDKAVSGASTVTISDIESSISLAETPNIEQKKVVLECENPVALSTDQTAPTTVHIAVPGGVEHEFSVYIVTDKGAYYKKVSSAKEIVAGEIKKMGALNLSGPEFEGKRMSYVENGVYLGEGVAIQKDENSYFVWAPFNCGYEPKSGSYAGYPYGKLFQWGRKYGQGYSDIDEADATVPEIQNGPVSLAVGQSIDNANVFYTGRNRPNDWLSPQKDDLWGTTSMKTKYDPCPSGWRVPTANELLALSANKSDYSRNELNNIEWGYYFSGYSNAADAPKVFLSNVGYREHLYNNGGANRKTRGYYWSSTVALFPSNDPEYLGASYLEIQTSSVGINSNARAIAYSVRCIKE